MSNISKFCGLSRIYTNYSIRVTGTVLNWDDFSPKQIMSVTSHKSVQSLTIYQCVESHEKMTKGKSLVKSFSHSKTQCSAGKIPSTEACASKPVHVHPPVAFEQEVQDQAPNKNEISEIPSDIQLIPYDANLDQENYFDLLEILEEVEKANTTTPGTTTQNLTTNTYVVNRNSPKNMTSMFSSCHIGQIHFHINKR